MAVLVVVTGPIALSSSLLARVFTTAEVTRGAKTLAFFLLMLGFTIDFILG
jgi:hypothetical protein